MNQLYIFLLRAILGGVIAIVIARTFRPDGGPLTVVGLAVLFVGTAYLLDYFRKRNIS
ncbi:MAG: hypothetical protein U9Q05_05800 [Thermodesulfobacteriota bacterium]|nr:hypothetical protein [Thermodesulfobacteriota bacterium]